MRPAHIRNTCILVCAVLSVAACSTTRRLGSDEVLYTGVKKIRIEPDSGVVLSAAAESAVKEPLSVAPNNPLYSPYIRTPLPIGLWAYNYLYTPREKGFKYWLFKRLAKQPVLISKVQPRLRTKVAEQVLENYGYFGSHAADSLLYRKHGRKAKVYYTLGIAPPWHYSKIAYPEVDSGMEQLMDSLRATSLLRVGAQYNMDSLTLERKRISQLLRNRGYYYFRPEYLEYLADTTSGLRQVDLRLNLKPNLPEVALKPYRVGGITVRLTNIKPGPTDTLRLRNATVIAQRPMKIRPRILSRALTLRSGQLFTVDAQNRDRPQQPGHFPFRQPERHAARLAAGLRHAGRRHRRAVRLSAGSRPGNGRNLEVEQLHRPRHHLQGQQQQPVPGRRSPRPETERLVRMADGQQKLRRPFLTAQLL